MAKILNLWSNTTKKIIEKAHNVRITVLNFLTKNFRYDLCGRPIAQNKSTMSHYVQSALSTTKKFDPSDPLRSMENRHCVMYSCLFFITIYHTQSDRILQCSPMQRSLIVIIHRWYRSKPISHEFRETLMVTHATCCFKVLTKSSLPDHFPVIGSPAPQGPMAKLLANNANVIAQKHLKWY